MKKRQKKLLSILEKNKRLTPFEKRVYEAVLSIPSGELRSYKWVAAKTGSPKSARAVGGALRKNPYVGCVPCHRVIKSDGTLGGFSRGLKAKLRLLSSEGLDFKAPI